MNTLSENRGPVWGSVWTWFWVGLLLAGAPLLAIYFSRMWRLPHYQYFPFAIAAVIGLAWQRSDKRFYPPAGIFSLACVLLGVLSLVLSWRLASPWLAAIAFVFFSAGCLSVMRGPTQRSLVSLALPLLLLVRLPLGYDKLLTISLQRVTTVLSSFVLDVIRIPHAVTHNTIALPERELFVAEACSGIQSVFTLAFIATLVVVFFRRKLVLAPLYLVVAVLLAVAGNALRVTSVAAFDYWLGWDLSTGWAHDLLGYTTLGLAVLMLLSYDRLIGVLFHGVRSGRDAIDANPLIRLWNFLVGNRSHTDLAYDRGETSDRTSRLNGWLAGKMSAMQSKPGWVCVILFAVLMLAGTAESAYSDRRIVLGMFTPGLIYDPPEGTIETISQDFRLADRVSLRDSQDPVLGQNSDSWTYTRTLDGNLVRGQFVISQSYLEYHELCLCYENMQWELMDRQLRVSDGNDADGIAVAHAIFKIPTGPRRHLYYSSITGSGQLPPPPASPGRLAYRIGDNFTPTALSSEPLMMLQLLVSSESKLSKREASEILSDFTILRDWIASEVERQQRLVN